MAPLSLRRHSLAVFLTAALLLTSTAHAQIEVVPPTTIPHEQSHGSGQPSFTYDVVGGLGARVLVLWTEYAIGGPHSPWPRTIATRPIETDAATFGPIARYDFKSGQPGVALSGSRGTFFAGWSVGKDFLNHDLVGRTFDQAGAPVSDVNVLADEFADDDGVRDIAAAGDDVGHTIAWTVWGAGIGARRVARDGTPGFEVVVDPLFGGSSIGVASTIDGGFVVAWGGPIFARGYTAVGVPKSVPVGFTGDNTDLLEALVASPIEDVLAAVIQKFDYTTNGPYPLVLQRFTSDGTLLGSAVPIADLPDVGHADAAFDRNGNLYVIWSSYMSTLRIQAYHRDGSPIGPIVDTGIAAGPSVHVARLGNDDFVNVWRDGQELRYDVVSLCVPGSAVCGDGLLDTLCEHCDDGAANDDTTADACRTNCEPARCGDGTVDAGEACDDGNVTDCDGCSGECVVEVGLGCGDGIPFPTCGEACDDGNGIEGDGCASCVLERALGSGSPSTDCLTEWSIDNPANEPRYAKSGAINEAQACTDNDQRCDFDGGIVGSCTFHLRVCANDTNLPECTPGSRLASWEIRTPSAAQATTRPAAAAVRDALLSVVPGAIVGSSQHDVCSPFAAVPVALRGTADSYGNGHLTVKTRATLYDKRKDYDKVRFECRP